MGKLRTRLAALVWVTSIPRQRVYLGIAHRKQPSSAVPARSHILLATRSNCLRLILGGLFQSGPQLRLRALPFRIVLERIVVAASLWFLYSYFVLAPSQISNPTWLFLNCQVSPISPIVVASRPYRRFPLTSGFELHFICNRRHVLSFKTWFLVDCICLSCRIIACSRWPMWSMSALGLRSLNCFAKQTTKSARNASQLVAPVRFRPEQSWRTGCVPLVVRYKFTQMPRSAVGFAGRCASS